MAIKIKKSVEDWVNEVNYHDYGDYIPSKFALEFVNFIKLVNGTEGEEHKTPIMHMKMLDQIAGSKENIANLCYRGAAKAVALNTKIITPSGFKLMRDISIGDTIIDRNGEATKVTHVSEVFNKPTYTITLVDGSTLVVSDDHINIVQKKVVKQKGNKRTSKFVEYEKTTKELLSEGVRYNRKMSPHNPSGSETKWYIPTIAAPVYYMYREAPLDPYTCGLILGDGSIDKQCGFVRFHTHIDDVEEFRKYIPYTLGEVLQDRRRPSTVRFSIKKIGKKVKEFLTTNNVYTKAVPENLLYNSIAIRLATLQGLMDTDGTTSGSKGTSFTTVSYQLAKDVRHLVKSLGGYAVIKKNNWNGSTSYIVNIRTTFNPFRLKRKAAKWVPNKVERVGILSITPTSTIVPSKCIAVGSDTHSFVTNDFVVTHNTTVMAEYLFLYLAVYGAIPGFGEVTIAIYVSDSIENGVKNMRKNLEYRWENSEFLKKYVPKVRFTDVRYEFENIDGKKLIVKSYGAKTGVRGAKEQGRRVDLAILDDLLSDDDARSPTIIKSIEDTVYKAIDYALHPTRSKVIWSGTPFNQNDPLYKAIESGGWYVNVYPVCEHFDASTTKETFVGAWGDRHDYKYVKSKYDKAIATGQIASFNQELMLRIMSDEDRLITDNDIVWYDRYSVLKYKSNYNFYITTDFATSEKTSADFSVISVWAYNNNGDWLYVDGVIKRQTMDKNLDDLFRFATMYKPDSVGIEVTGQQGGFIQWIREQQISRNIFFKLASEGNSGKEGIRPNTNKMVRFNTVVPLFKAKKIWFPKDLENTQEMQEIMNELRNASTSGFKSKHDDFIDTVSMLSVMNPWKPSEALPIEYNESAQIWEEPTDYSDNFTIGSYIV